MRYKHVPITTIGIVIKRAESSRMPFVFAWTFSPTAKGKRHCECYVQNKCCCEAKIHKMKNNKAKL